MTLEELREDIARGQKKGLPFIIASAIIWTLISIVSALDIHIYTKNLLVFCCSCPLLPVSWLVGRRLGVDIFSRENPLGRLGFLFTMNQLLYLLIVMWVFDAVPGKMVMVYAMVFGAHLLPYSWLYKSSGYRIFAIVIPIVALALGSAFGSLAVAAAMAVLEAAFVLVLFGELRKMPAGET